MADALTIAQVSLESHGHMALEWLERLVDHDGLCTRMHPMFCEMHLDLAQKFLQQVMFVNDCRKWIERGAYSQWPA